jgi:hypothetical protein
MREKIENTNNPKEKPPQQEDFPNKKFKTIQTNTLRSNSASNKRNTPTTSQNFQTWTEVTTSHTKQPQQNKKEP